VVANRTPQTGIRPGGTSRHLPLADACHSCDITPLPGRFVTKMQNRKKAVKSNLVDFIFRALIAFGCLNREPALELPISRPVTESGLISNLKSLRFNP
jgi:hypothetical protein